MKQFLILAPYPSNRLIFVLNELLTRRLGIEYKVTENEDYFIKSTSPKINYGNQIIEGCLNIPLTNLLFQENIIEQTLEVTQNTKWHTTFYNKPYEEIPDAKIETHWLHFDLFAASFFLLSRYEEYLPNKPDGHGRYNHANSLAFKHHFLQLPLIDIWLKTAKSVLLKVYPNLEFASNQFKQINSVDIDLIYKFKQHSWFSLFKQKIGHIVKGRKEALVQQNALTNNQINDPYNTFKLLTQNSNNITTAFFWLLSNNKHKLDANLPINNPAYQTIINQLPNTIINGLHPSYNSSVNKKELAKEITNFKTIFGVEPTLSRWHFLKITLPYSYQNLLTNKFTEDWSLAYANMPGFRASTAQPFNFYNLKTETETSLLVQPIALMDVSLKNGLNLNATEAIKLVKQLKDAVKEVNGTFISIWHNSSFDETEGWNGWDKVYQSLFN